MLSKEVKAAVAEVARKAYWRQRDAEIVLAAFAQNGGTMMGFAKECGVNPEKLYRWHRKLGSRRQELTPAASTFHPLLVVDQDASDAGVEVVVGGLRVAVHRGFDEQTLLRVVRLLDSGTC